MKDYCRDDNFIQVDRLELHRTAAVRQLMTPKPVSVPAARDPAGCPLLRALKNTLCSFKPTHSVLPWLLLPNTGLSNHSGCCPGSRKSKSSQTNAGRLSRSSSNRCHRLGLREPERHNKQWGPMTSSICAPQCPGWHQPPNSSWPRGLVNGSLTHALTMQNNI